MTVAATARSAGPFSGTGAAATLPFTFKVFGASDVAVYRGDTLLTLGSDYTVAINGDQEATPGGSVAITATAFPTGSTVFVDGATSAEQPARLLSLGPWLPSAVEQALDRLAMVVQQLKSTVSRAVLLPRSGAAWAGKFIAVDASGVPYGASGTGADAALRTDLATAGAPLVSFARTGQGKQTLEDKLLRIFEVEDFRVTEAGATLSDIATLQAAVAAWAVQGTGYLLADPGRTYDLGNFGIGAPELLAVTGITNGAFDGRGCKFVLNSTANGARPLLFVPRNYINLAFRNFTVTDTGADLSVDWRGVYVFVPTADNGAYVQRTLVIDNIQVTNAVAFLFAQGTNSPMSGIEVTASCRADTCYYGLVFSEAGNDVVATLRTVNCRRSYFPYGVRRHKVTIYFDHDATALGAEALCLIKRYAKDTGEIDLTIFATGSLAQHDNIVKIEHQPNSGVSTISGISIDYRLDPAIDFTMSAAARTLYGRPAGTKTTPLTLSSYLANGTEETTTTANVWKGISVRGNAGIATGDHVQVRVKPTTPAEVALTPGCGVSPMALNHKGNVRFITAHGREFLTKKGDQTGTFDIDLSRFDNVNLVLGLAMTFMGGTDGTGSQNRSYLEWTLFLTIPAGGPITVNSNPNAINQSVGTAITLSAFNVTGKVLNIALSGAPYNGANAFGKIEVVAKALGE